MDIEEALATLERVAAQHADLRLLVLHGSRSQGHLHDRSDWDLGYLAALPFDPGALHSDLTRTLATEDVDLVDLARASALLRFRAARDGHCVYEEQPGEFDTFVMEATLFWCDIEPIVRRAHDAVLSRLPG